MRNKNLETAKLAIREPYSGPGGYPIYMILSNGELLCRDCARENWRSIVDSTKHGYGDGWEVVGVDVLWEGLDFCTHCSKQLESAYGDESSD
jgi:hypothetical protein